MADSDSRPDFAAQAGAAAALVHRILSGDTVAETELVERYSRGVYFLLSELTRDRARADDLHQETFRLVIEKVRAGELREPERLPGFIRQLAKNLFIADYRKTALRSMEDLETVPQPAAPAPDQLVQVLQEEDTRLVRELLAGLQPERDRLVLFRFYLAGEPREKICADLGLTVGTFNVALHRARQRFKTLVETNAARRRPAAGAALR
jgi:RNA polymerase sigma-70 factor, ECF subfamily